MIIVGELINASRKRIAEAIRARDEETIQRVAKKQAGRDASYIDVNAGVFEDEEAELLQWLVGLVQVAVDVPCSIDSPNPAVVEAGLERHQGPALVNSISLEQSRLDGLSPLLAGTDHRVIALCVTDEGMPQTTDDRLAVADKLVNHLVQKGLKTDHIFVDPLVQPVSTDGAAPLAALRAIAALRERFPEVHTICGLSNVSFGLPQRKILNQTFAAMAIAWGLDGAILNPMDDRLRTTIIAAETLAGRDEWCERYLNAHRAEELVR